MRIIIALVLLAFFTASCQTENENKVIYLLRHAEKDLTPKNDPPLTTDGVIRSVDLSSWFKGISIDVLLSTNYARTKETVKPLAESQNLQTGLYDANDLGAFAKSLSEMEADTIVVVGHSNTILELIEALEIDRPQEAIDDEEYDKIFEVQLAKKEVVTHSYGSKYSNSVLQK